MVQPKQEKDFALGSPEEFVRRFGGTKVINKVNIMFILLKTWDILTET